MGEILTPRPPHVILKTDSSVYVDEFYAALQMFYAVFNSSLIPGPARPINVA